MTVPKTSVLVLDCADPPSSARFYATLLGAEIGPAEGDADLLLLAGPSGIVLGSRRYPDRVPPSWPMAALRSGGTENGVRPPLSGDATPLKGATHRPPACVPSQRIQTHKAYRDLILKGRKEHAQADQGSMIRRSIRSSRRLNR
ncbi:VOC family protein [Streptomyces lavendulae]|uniref:VOC family protein n=1 Tax=Streptomyces lavendulae TaxID=1914 RepID=UPI00373AEA45